MDEKKIRYELGRYKDKVERQQAESKILKDKIIGLNETLSIASAVISSIMVKKIGDSNYYEEYIPAGLMRENLTKYSMTAERASDGYLMRIEREKSKKEKAPEGHKINPLYIETKSRRVQLVLQPSLYTRVKEKAKEDNISVNEYIHHILDIETKK